MDRSLEADSILKSYGEKTILTDVYISCRQGDIIGLFGRNGTGKSTLLQIIFGILKGDRSFIRIDGKIQKHAAYRSGKIAYLPQHNFLPPKLKIPDILHFYIPKERHKEFLADPLLFKVRKQHTRDLSHGELRYLEIKLILFSNAPYLLLDEPFNALSPITAQAVREQIAKSALTHGILLTDHNFREVHKIVNRILLLDQGYLKEIKEPRELIPYGYYHPPI